MHARCLVPAAVSFALAMGLGACEPRSGQPPASADETPAAEPNNATQPDPASASRKAENEAPAEPAAPNATPDKSDRKAPDAVADPPADDGPLAPLPQPARTAIDRIEADPAPPHLVRDTHYWISNEQSHFLWHDALADLGGALIGVGTDQNYLLAGWARSEFIVLADFDIGVANLHHAYGVLFDHATTPSEFIAQWTAEQEAGVVERLRANVSAEHRDGAVDAYRQARALVHERLQQVDSQYRALGIATFLSDAEQYAHLRTLWRNGRVLALRGDLTADRTYVQIGAALKQAGLDVNVLYLSNAEQYFKYTPEFRRNMIGLPMGERGVVLRTNGWKQFRYVKDEEYHYNIQPARGFAQWMEQGHAWGVPAMLKKRSKTDTRGLSRLDAVPNKAPGRAPPRVAE